MLKNARQIRRIKKLSEDNAMCFHSENSALGLYYNDTIKMVQRAMRNLLLFSKVTMCQGTVQTVSCITIHRLHRGFLKLG